MANFIGDIAPALPVVPITKRTRGQPMTRSLQGDGRESPSSGRPTNTLPHDSILPLIPHLRAFARSLAAANHDLADDVVQDTLMLALRHWDSFVPGTNLKAWLLQIV